MFGRNKTLGRPQIQEREQAAAEGPNFRAQRAQARRTYIRIVEATKGLQKWGPEDDAFLDLIDARIVDLHRRACRPVPHEVLEKAPPIQAQADELLGKLEAGLQDPALGDRPLDERPVVPMVGGAR